MWLKGPSGQNMYVERGGERRGEEREERREREEERGEERREEKTYPSSPLPLVWRCVVPLCHVLCVCVVLHTNAY